MRDGRVVDVRRVRLPLGRARALDQRQKVLLARGAGASVQIARPGGRIGKGGVDAPDLTGPLRVRRAGGEHVQHAGLGVIDAAHGAGGAGVDERAGDERPQRGGGGGAKSHDGPPLLGDGDAGGARGAVRVECPGDGARPQQHGGICRGEAERKGSTAICLR